MVTKKANTRRLFTLFLTEAEHQQLGRIAEAQRRNKSEVIRSWLQSASRVDFGQEVMNGVLKR